MGLGDRTTLETELTDAGEALQERLAAEQTTREVVQQARAVLEQLERQVREHRDQARRIELDRDGASREHLETHNRREALEIERQQLADALDVTERELIAAREQVSIAPPHACENRSPSSWGKAKKFSASTA